MYVYVSDVVCILCMWGGLCLVVGVLFVLYITVWYGIVVYCTSSVLYFIFILFFRFDYCIVQVLCETQISGIIAFSGHSFLLYLYFHLRERDRKF